MKIIPAICLSSLIAGMISFSPVRAAELIMFEQAACEWCERWNEEVGVVYHKTAEGKRTPLRRVNIHDKLPNDINHVNPGRYTPTFVLMDEGMEIARIRGYPGEAFFWELLGQMVQKLPTQNPKMTKSEQD